MPTTLTYYGGTKKYGDADAYYGRISSALAAGQLTEVRQTALRIKVVDDRRNAWTEILNTGEIYAATTYLGAASTADKNPANQSYIYYRPQAALVKKSNGDLYRVRLGDPTSTSDRQVYEQTITDPTISSQWSSWSLKYSGSHYAVAAFADGTGEFVYDARSNGLYRNNSLVWTKSGIIAINPIQGKKDALYITVVSASSVDGKPIADVWYTPDIMSVAPFEDPNNFDWRVNSVQAYSFAGASGPWNATQLRIHMAQWQLSNHRSTPQRSLAIEFAYDDDTIDAFTGDLDPPLVFRGLGGSSGLAMLRIPFLLRKLSDGFFYLFSFEAIPTGSELDPSDIPNSLGVVWQRSKDGRYWSAPTVAGGDLSWFAGAEEFGGYVYLAGNSCVIRRPMTSVEYDISNYVPSVEFELPRENQAGTGTLLVANPAGVHDSYLNTSDRQLTIEPGLQLDEGPEYVEFSDWYITKITKELKAATNRLHVEFGDLWSRLANQLRDNINFVGRIDWNDWVPGARNKAFNYYFPTGVPTEWVLTPTVSYLKVSTGLGIYTGWKGSNAWSSSVTFYAPASSDFLRFIYRYKDANNYNYVQFQKSTNDLKLYRRSNGVNTLLYDTSATGQTTGVRSIRIKYIFKKIAVYIDGNLELTYTESAPRNYFGYEGFSSSASNFTIKTFRLIDHEWSIWTEDLIKWALALADYHDVQVSDPEKQLDIMWGPNTDAPDPATALRQVLEAKKYQLLWRDGFIVIGKFIDSTTIRTIENEIIEASDIDQGSQRPNVIQVEGNDSIKLLADAADNRNRGISVVARFDLPELLTQAAVNDRANEELRRAQLGQSPGGMIPLQFDLHRMDRITWIDPTGESFDVRIEGMKVIIRQDEQPSQRQELDTTLFETL